MAYPVERFGFTVLNTGVKGDGDIPLVNIVFVHGLWGHPRRTWETEAPASVRAGDGRPSLESRRKNSFADIMRRGSKRPTPSTTSSTDLIRKETASSLEIWNSAQLQESSGSVQKSGKCYWPKDLLPLDLPDAKIFTYGYDADVVGSSHGDETKIHNFTSKGQDLLVKLEREIETGVPIIFCAHSLGGIIVKDALHRSKSNLNERLRKVHQQTKCVVFLGTPHRGSRLATWTEIFTKIGKFGALEVRKKLVNSLKIDSEILENIHSEFVKMLFSGDFYIHSFQEGRPLNAAVGKVVDDFSSKFDENPMQIVETIDASHRDMARFRSEDEPGYRQIASALRKYTTALAPGHDTERISIATSFSSRFLGIRTVFCVPYERNSGFVGRENNIQDIEKRLAGPGGNRFVAIHGLGGIGKSQVAIELAYRWKDSFPKTSILWIHAASRDRLDQSYRDILGALNIPESPETNAETVITNWLLGKNSGRWLMVVDNVDDENIVFEKKETGTKLLSCIPKSENGLVLFTTRYKRIAMKLADEIVEVVEMSEEEASSLLSRSLKDNALNPGDIKELLTELGCIPLAINQAASFIREYCSGIAEYLENYRESEADRMVLLGEEPSADEDNISGSDIPKSILGTWFISFSHLKKDGLTGTLASDILSVGSFMDRQEIPRSLLVQLRKSVLKSQYTKAFGTLKSMSLITETDHQTFSMHRLVQLSMRRWLQLQETDQKFAEEALGLLATVFPDGSFQTWKACSELVVHADAVLSLLTGFSNSLVRAKLLNNVAAFQISRGQYSAAEFKLVEVVKIKSEVLGPDRSLDANDSLSLVLRQQAKYDAAEALSQKTLSRKEAVFGRDHVDTLKTAHIVATLLGDRSKHKLAEVENRPIWETRRKILGSEHVDTLASAANLVLSLWELGRYDEAENLAREVLATRERLLGEEHPDTLNIARTLGFILEIIGKYTEAEEIKRQTLSIRERVLGEDHPDTANSLHDMAWILHQEGHYAEAEDFYDRALQSKRKLLGPYHPSTLETMCNMPVFYCDMGKYTEAENASKTIVHKFERIQGPKHSQTLDALGDMAIVLRHCGKLDAASHAARRSIQGEDEVIGTAGKHHPSTLPTIVQYGYIMVLQGHQREGEKTIRDALAEMENSLGNDNPSVMTGLVCLSKTILRGEEDQLGEAEAIARRALEGRTRVLGPEHPYAFKTMYHLSMVLLARKQYSEAESICRHSLDGMQRTLGTEHPDVSRCADDYEKILNHAGLEDLDLDRRIEARGYVDLSEA